jgi:MSHA pilin protein MshC
MADVSRGCNVVKIASVPFQRGFTLVELVVTLVLVGIIAAISGPLFFRKETFDEYGFYNETLAAVRYGQKLAAATCSGVHVRLTATGYSLFRAAAAPANGCNIPCTDPGTAIAVANPSDPSNNFAKTAPTGVAITPVDVVFCPAGNTLAGTNATISVGSKQFTIWGATGLVR